jgi:hypothetical protein
MVSMKSRREAETCVNDLNGYEWFGRKIGVKLDETGGQQALAAAAMAGATLWEGVGLSQAPLEFEVPLFPETVVISFASCLHFVSKSMSCIYCFLCTFVSIFSACPLGVVYLSTTIVST